MERYCLALLCNMEGVGLFKTAELLKRFDSAEDIWRADFDRLEKAAGSDRQLAVSIAVGRKKMMPEQLAQVCQKKNFRIITYADKDYPEALLNTGRAPLALFICGFLPAGDKIAMVGSRKASPYGIAAAKQFAADLSRRAVTVVSGGAKGIDTAAHKGALESGCATVAVFGCGLDIAYPYENKKLFKEIVETGGALLSEYLPGAEPAPWRFPARNRIISGLSKGVLVVEANKKSGSLITANFALESGREVYCLPGSIYSAGSIGGHNLIKQGARLVDRPEDILEDLGRLPFGAGGEQRKCEIQMPAGDAGKILRLFVDGQAACVEELADKSGLAPDKVNCALLELELTGWIKAMEGRYLLQQRGMA